MAPNTTLTREQAEILIGEIAGLTVKANKLGAERQLAIAAAEKPLVEARNLHCEKLNKIDKSIMEKTALVAEWAKASKTDEKIFKGKTADLKHGEIAFKLGRPAVVLLETWTDQLVIGALKKFKKLKELFIDLKPRLDRTAILKAFKDELVDAETLGKIGVAVLQEENFSLKLKLDNAPEVPDPA